MPDLDLSDSLDWSLSDHYPEGVSDCAEELRCDENGHIVGDPDWWRVASHEDELGLDETALGV